MEKKEERGKEIPTFFPPLFSSFFFANGSIYHSFFPFFLLRFQPPPQKKKRGRSPPFLFLPSSSNEFANLLAKEERNFAGRNTPLFSLSPRPAFSRMLAQFSQVLGFPNLFRSLSRLFGFLLPEVDDEKFSSWKFNWPRGREGGENEEGGADTPPLPPPPFFPSSCIVV